MSEPESLLREAGWRPGRRQDIAAVLAALKENGYGVSAAAEGFLHEFSGILIQFERNGRKDAISFDAQSACSLADPEWVEYYGTRVGEQLTPVGYSNHRHMLIMQSRSGSFYGGFDEFLGRLGASPLEMIDNIVHTNVPPID